jgi:hypothetical protein
MTGGRLGDPRPADGLFDLSLEHGLVKMVPAPLSGLPADIGAGGRKNPLPRPLSSGVGVLSRKGTRKLHPPGALLDVAAVLPLDPLKVARELGHERRRQKSHSVLVTLSLLGP